MSKLGKLFVLPIQLFLMVSVLVSCDDSIPPPESDSDETNTVTLNGQVTDAVSGEGIEGARVEIGTRTAVTDILGFYEITDVPTESGLSLAAVYEVSIDLSQVTFPIDMTNSGTSPRYPARKLEDPIRVSSLTATLHDFQVGKLSASIRGVVGDGSRLPVRGAIIELLEFADGVEGETISTTTSDEQTGAYSFENIESGSDYRLFGRSEDGLLQGDLVTGTLDDGQALSLTLGDASALLLTSLDSFPPRIIAVSPENNADVEPGPVEVVFTFNEPIEQDEYSIPDVTATSNNIYVDIDVEFGGQKSVDNSLHTMNWNANHDQLTIVIPDTGISSRYSVDLSALSPSSSSDQNSGKLRDLSGNTLISSPVLTSGNVLNFTTNGGVLTEAPVLASPNAAGVDSDAASVTLDWLPVPGAVKGYNIYRSTRASHNGDVETPFELLAGPVTDSIFIDTSGFSGFSLLASSETAQYYVYKVTSINSDLIESDFSNEVVVRDTVSPTIANTEAICVAPGEDSRTILSPVTPTTNGQVQIAFSEPLDVLAAEDINNYAGTSVSAAKLITSATVVLDFSSPIDCESDDMIVIGVGVIDVFGNALQGTDEQRTITYAPES